MEDQAQTVSARIEVAKELLHTTEEWEKKYQDKLTLLEVELVSSWGKATDLESQLEKEELKKLKADLEKKMESAKAALAQERDKRRDTEKAAWEAEKKMWVVETWAQEVASQALTEFRASQKFEDEVVEGSTIAYPVGFKDCEMALCYLHPKLDLSEL